MNNQFVKDSLLPGEKIIATAKFHGIKMWICVILFSILLYLLLTFIMGLIGKSYYYYLDTFIVWFVDISLTIDIIAQGDMGELIVLLLGISATIGSIICAYRFSKWLFAFDEFAITSKRVIAKVGVIRRIAFELQNEQIESIEIHQGIIGRILNYGTLMPCGIGASKVRIPFVVSPFEFRQYFYDLKKPQNS